MGATPRCTLVPMRRLASQHTPSYPLQRQLPRQREPRPSLVCSIQSTALGDPTGDMARLHRTGSDNALHTGSNASSGVPAHSIIPAAAPAASSARHTTLSSLFYQVRFLGRPCWRYGPTTLRRERRCAAHWSQCVVWRPGTLHHTRCSASCLVSASSDPH